MKNTMSTSSSSHGNRLRILIVEDEALVAMELEYMLESAGNEPVAIADHHDAAVAAARATRPDIALVDVQLAQGDNGVDVARSLKELGIPVLFATGNCPGDRGAEVAIGCLHKPLTDKTLALGLAAARQVLSGAEPEELAGPVHFYRSTPTAER
jgi:CheY-like chemotaxis protein